VRISLPLFMFRIYRGLSTPYGFDSDPVVPALRSLHPSSSPVFPPCFLSLPVSSGPPRVPNRTRPALSCLRVLRAPFVLPTYVKLDSLLINPGLLSSTRRLVTDSLYRDHLLLVAVVNKLRILKKKKKKKKKKKAPNGWVGAWVSLSSLYIEPSYIISGLKSCIRLKLLTTSIRVQASQRIYLSFNLNKPLIRL